MCMWTRCQVFICISSFFCQSLLRSYIHTETYSHQIGIKIVNIRNKVQAKVYFIMIKKMRNMYTPKKKNCYLLFVKRKLRKKSFNQQRSMKTIKTRRKCKPNKQSTQLHTKHTQHIYKKNVSKSQNKLSERERKRINERWKLFRFDLRRRRPGPPFFDGWMVGCGDDDRREMCYLYLEFLNKVLVTCAVIAASAWQVRLTLWGGFRKN